MHDIGILLAYFLFMSLKNRKIISSESRTMWCVRRRIMSNKKYHTDTSTMIDNASLCYQIYLISLTNHFIGQKVHFSYTTHRLITLLIKSILILTSFRESRIFFMTQQFSLHFLLDFNA
jgi:hypothetical protein